jgi:hypothetical protein
MARKTRAKITAATLVPSLIRTYVPVAVGAVAAWLAVKGLNVDPGIQVGATSVLTALLTAGYFTAIRTLEIKYPALSILLGHKAQPVAYVKPAKLQ